MCILKKKQLVLPKVAISYSKTPNDQLEGHRDKSIIIENYVPKYYY